MSDPSRPAGDLATDPAADPNPAAGGRTGWVVIGAVAVVLIVVLGLSYAGSSSSSGSQGSAAAPGTTAAVDSGPCTPPTNEALDPTSAIRLLPNAAEPTYASDPPTSGAFVVGASVDPVSKEGLARPVQVGLLAQGKVLIQYSASASPADVTDLEGLAGGDIVVAPNPTMADPFVATAWRTRQVCPVLDLAALRQFATLNANRAPDAEATTTTTGG